MGVLDLTCPSECCLEIHEVWVLQLGWHLSPCSVLGGGGSYTGV